MRPEKTARNQPEPKKHCNTKQMDGCTILSVRQQLVESTNQIQFFVLHQSTKMTLLLTYFICILLHTLEEEYIYV